MRLQKMTSALIAACATATVIAAPPAAFAYDEVVNGIETHWPDDMNHDDWEFTTNSSPRPYLNEETLRKIERVASDSNPSTTSDEWGEALRGAVAYTTFGDTSAVSADEAFALLNVYANTSSSDWDELEKQFSQFTVEWCNARLLLCVNQKHGDGFRVSHARTSLPTLFAKLSDRQRSVLTQQRYADKTPIGTPGLDNIRALFSDFLAKETPSDADYVAMRKIAFSHSPDWSSDEGQRAIRAAAEATRNGFIRQSLAPDQRLAVMATLLRVDTASFDDAWTKNFCVGYRTCANLDTLEISKVWGGLGLADQKRLEALDIDGRLGTRIGSDAIAAFENAKAAEKKKEEDRKKEQKKKREADEKKLKEAEEEAAKTEKKNSLSGKANALSASLNGKSDDEVEKAAEEGDGSSAFSPDSIKAIIAFIGIITALIGAVSQFQNTALPKLIR